MGNWTCSETDANAAKAKKKVSFAYALLVMVLVFSCIMIPVFCWNAKINALFLIGWAVAIVLCLPTGCTYKAMEAELVKKCTRAIVPAMIVLCVGGMVGTWNAAGTIPFIISLGMRSISPHYFLLAAFLLSMLATLITGTSWGTFGTVGMALAGIGQSLNMDPVLTAGAVCSGAFFGDGISPLADSANMASAVSGVDLFAGLRHQARVAFPAALICAVLYWLKGMEYRGGTVNTAMISEIAECIDRNFQVGPCALLPVIFVIVLLAVRIPAVPAILSGGIFGGLVACLYQGTSPADIISYFWGGYQIESGMEFVDTLLSRGGVASMADTVLMLFFAFGLFGILNAAGIVDALVSPVVGYLKSKLSLVAAALGMSVFGTFVGASMNFAYVFAGSIMEPIYIKRGLRRENLMRALSVGCTGMTALVPWSLSSAVAAEFLNVAPVQLIPGNYYAIIAPLVLIIWTAIGRDTLWVGEIEKKCGKTSERVMKG